MASGCIKHNTLNQNNNGCSFSSSGSSTGFDAEQDPYTGAYLAPARDGTNITMYTWNAALAPAVSVYRVWRIITETNPRNFSLGSNWDATSNPTNIITNLGNNPQTLNITRSAKEGDLYRDWVDGDYYDGWYVCYLITYTNDSNYYQARYTWPGANGRPYPIQNYCISSAPSLSFDKSTGNFSIGKSMAGRRFIEFHRADKSYGYPTSISDEETLNEMLLASIIKQEYSDAREMYYGYYSVGDRKLNRWAKGTYTVGVNFKDTQNYSTINQAINTAISEINSVLNSYGVYFKRSGTSGDMSIIVDTEWNMYGIDLDTADWVYGGTWETEHNSSGYNTSATVKLVSDVYDVIPFGEYEIAAFEEIVQCMGAGYDQVEYPFDTVHTEFNYFNKSASLTTKDKNILKLVYSSYVDAGDTHYEVSKKLNIPKGVYRVSTSTTNSVRTVSFDEFLDKGVPYYVRAFIVNSYGELSYTSSWMKITTPSVLAWSWSKSNGSATTTQTKKAYTAITSNGYVSDFSYKVWNDMVDKTKEALDACGESWSSKYATYANTRMSSSDKVLTATKFNSLRFNIGSHEATGIADKSKDEYVYGEYFTILTDKLNTWINSI